MGWFDLLTCFRCSESPSPEADVLIAPGRLRAHSITSQHGYGTMTMNTNVSEVSGRSPAASSPPRITDAQRQRMTEISRDAGSHMRPIGTYVLGQGRVFSPIMRSVSTPSSRESSPSPPRPLTSPPGGVITGLDLNSMTKLRTASDASQISQISDMGGSRSSSADSADAVTVGAGGVIRKSIFPDGQPARRTSGSRRLSTRRRVRS